MQMQIATNQGSSLQKEDAHLVSQSRTGAAGVTESGNPAGGPVATSSASATTTRLGSAGGPRTTPPADRLGADQKGYLTSGVQRYVWDDLGRMKSCCGLAEGARYFYRADGLRNRKVSDLTIYWHDDDSEESKEESSGWYDENLSVNKPTTRYFYDGQMVLRTTASSLQAKKRSMVVIESVRRAPRPYCVTVGIDWDAENSG